MNNIITYPNVDVAGDVQSFAASLETEKWLSKATMLEISLDYSILTDPDLTNAVEDQTVKVEVEILKAESNDKNNEYGSNSFLISSNWYF